MLKHPDSRFLNNSHLTKKIKFLNLIVLNILVLARKSYVDTVDMSTLDAEIQKYVEHDNNKKNENNENNENTENIENNGDNENNEDIQYNMSLNENANEKDDESDEEQHASEEDIEYDSEMERRAHRLLYPDEDSDYSDSDKSSVESTFEL